jgi:hypothetical protein
MSGLSPPHPPPPCLPLFWGRSRSSSLARAQLSPLSKLPVQHPSRLPIFWSRRQVGQAGQGTAVSTFQTPCPAPILPPYLLGVQGGWLASRMSADFIALYGRLMATGFHTRVSINHSGCFQEISVYCCIPILSLHCHRCTGWCGLWLYLQEISQGNHRHLKHTDPVIVTYP